MVRTFLLTMAVLLVVASGKAHALGKWELVVTSSTNYWDFSVGKGKFCWVDYAGAPYYYSGSTACATGSPQGGTVEHTSDFSRGGTFPNGHAQRIAVGEAVATVLKPMLLVTTAEGYLWYYRRFSTVLPVAWVKGPALPSTLPTGMNGYGVTRLVYEAVNYYTGQAAQNPVWILGKDNHVYHLVGSGLGTTWQDVSVQYGLGPISQLSYSAMAEAVIVTWADGTSAYYDDNANGWYYITPSAPAPMAIDINYTFYFGASYYGAGGLFEALCSSRLADQSCAYTFQVGLFNWYDLDSLPALPGYPQIYSDDIDEAWPTTANGNAPDAETPINIAEGSYMQLSRQYGGGPSDPADYQDLLWVQTNKLRVYSYQIWLFENR